MIKIKKFRCFCLVSGTQPAICLECTHALRHRTEVLVAHSGRGHTNVASWGTPVFWPHGRCVPNCVKKVKLHKTLFFVSLSSYRNLLGPQKFWVNEKNKKTPSYLLQRNVRQKHIIAFQVLSRALWLTTADCWCTKSGLLRLESSVVLEISAPPTTYCLALGQSCHLSLYLCFLLRICLVYVHWVLWGKDQPMTFINIVLGMLEHDSTEVSSCYQSAK